MRPILKPITKGQRSGKTLDINHFAENMWRKYHDHLSVAGDGSTVGKADFVRILKGRYNHSTSKTQRAKLVDAFEGYQRSTMYTPISNLFAELNNRDFQKYGGGKDKFLKLLRDPKTGRFSKFDPDKMLYRGYGSLIDDTGTTRVFNVYQYNNMRVVRLNSPTAYTYLDEAEFQASPYVV